MKNKRLENVIKESRIPGPRECDARCIADENANLNKLEVDRIKSKSVNHKKRKILVVGDNNIRGVISLLKISTNNQFDINCQRLLKG